MTQIAAQPASLPVRPRAGLKTAIATVSIAGSLREKLEAIAAAGFDGIEIFEQDFIADAGMDRVAKICKIYRNYGYTTEVLVRAVGPTGVVYGHNTQGILDKFAGKSWGERLAKPINKNVVKVTRELDDPLPPEAKDLDAVFLVLFYHDTFWMKVDQAKMNAAVFRALKPGGVFVIVDHSGKAGSGTGEVKTLHRIEEAVVRSEVPAAGFRLGAEASFLRNADDKRDWNAAPGEAGEKRGTSDRFVLKFVKP